MDGDSPTVRLDQDGSSGWAAQSWDLCGNETNFFLRDVTNGSKLCFRVQPSTPSNTLCLKSDGKVGIGTWSPEAQFEIEKTGENAAVIFQRTDGATGKFTARPSEVYMGSGSQPSGSCGGQQRGRHDSNIKRLRRYRPDLPHTQTGRRHKRSLLRWHGLGGRTPVRSFKSNIRELASKDALAAVHKLTPVRYSYKQNKSEEYLGFIAEDVPEIVAMNDRKGLSPMDIVAVLTKVVQEQQKTIEVLSKRLEKLESNQQK